MAATPASLPWRAIVRAAVLGTLVLVLLVAMDVSRHGGNNPVSLIQPGTAGPATKVIGHDFPEVEQPDGLGLDGQLYYSIARDPVHLDDAAQHLDAPRYRLQRPLLPWLAWALHPSGGGTGLIYALLLVGLAGVFIGALATGALSTSLGGPAWLAVVFPLLPGAYWSLRVSVSDALALALVLAALAFASRERHLPAIAFGILAVLAKEPAILVLAGWALHRRTKRDTALLLIPAAVIVGWMGWLHLQLPTDPDRPTDLGLPFLGLVHAWREQWSHGQELVGMACTTVGLALGTAALVVRRLRHPLGWAIAGQVAFMLCMGMNPTAMNFGATRMAMTVTILAVIALFTPHPALAGDRFGSSALPTEADQPDDDAGDAGPADADADADAQDRSVDTSSPTQGGTGRSGPGVAVGASSNR